MYHGSQRNSSSQPDSRCPPSLLRLPTQNPFHNLTRAPLPSIYELATSVPMMKCNRQTSIRQDLPRQFHNRLRSLPVPHLPLRHALHPSIPSQIRPGSNEIPLIHFEEEVNRFQIRTVRGQHAEFSTLPVHIQHIHKLSRKPLRERRSQIRDRDMQLDVSETLQQYRSRMLRHTTRRNERHCRRSDVGTVQHR